MAGSETDLPRPWNHHVEWSDIGASCGLAKRRRLDCAGASIGKCDGTDRSVCHGGSGGVREGDLERGGSVFGRELDGGLPAEPSVVRALFDLLIPAHGLLVVFGFDGEARVVA